MKNPKISIVIPVLDTMENGKWFLDRCLKSIESQTYKDYEIVMTHEGSSTHNTNLGIKKATGDVIKIIHMDDYFYSPNSLQEIADKWPFKWLVTGCIHDDGVELYNEHRPLYDDNGIPLGINTIGAPSVLAIENKDPLLFDEESVWVFDCDYYKRLYDRYGPVTYLNKINVVIGIHPGQATNLITDDVKAVEEYFLREKYGHHKMSDD